MTQKRLTEQEEHRTISATRCKIRRNPQPIVFGLTIASCARRVEGKVAESFDVTVGEWLRQVSEGRQQRWDFLCGLLGLTKNCDPRLRYQLVHRAASAILQGERFHARVAILLVHSFSPTDQWFQDFASFAFQLGGAVTGPGQLIRLGTPGKVNLYAGWATPAQAAAI